MIKTIFVVDTKLDLNELSLKLPLCMNIKKKI